MSTHKICILAKNDDQVVLLGETHFKNTGENILCEKVVDKFDCIGYENAKIPATCLDKIVRYIMSKFYDSHSTILSKKIILENVRDKIPKDRDFYIIASGMTKPIQFKKEDIESKTDVFDLEQDHKLSIREQFTCRSVDYMFALFISSILCKRNVFLFKNLILGTSITYAYIIIPFIFNFILDNIPISYSLKSKLNYPFGTYDMIYKRDTIMANNINKKIIELNKSTMSKQSRKVLAITGEKHTEGIKWNLINKHEFIVKDEMYLDKYVSSIEKNNLWD